MNWSPAAEKAGKCVGTGKLLSPREQSHKRLGCSKKVQKFGVSTRAADPLLTAACYHESWIEPQHAQSLPPLTGSSCRTSSSSSERIGDVAVRWQDTLWHRQHILHNPPGPTTWRGVLDSINRLATLREPTYVWRGHESIGWKLTPSIYRKLHLEPPFANPQSARRAAVRIGTEVNALLARARGHGHDLQQGRPMSDLPLLAFLQHGGAATPLLDVTADPLVALFFACQPTPQTGEEDGLLLAIDARRDRMAEFDVSSQDTWAAALDHLQDEHRLLGLYVPPLVTPRILAQRGRFVFGATAVAVSYSALPVARHSAWSYERLRQLFGLRGPGRPAIPPVVGIRVPRNDKPRLREVLRIAFGLSHESLFPDFAGFASAHGTGGDSLSGA